MGRFVLIVIGHGQLDFGFEFHVLLLSVIFESFT